MWDFDAQPDPMFQATGANSYGQGDELGASDKTASAWPSAAVGSDDVGGFPAAASSSSKVNYFQGYARAESVLTPEAIGEVARAFVLLREVDGFVGADVAKKYLQSTNLSNEMLRSIWDLSDLDRDGRLSLREFVCAMHLSKLAVGAHVLPGEMRPENQEELALPVENMVFAGLVDEYEPASKHLRPADEFSTVDTLRLHTHGDLAGRAGPLSTTYSTAVDFEAVGAIPYGSNMSMQAAARGRDPTPRDVGSHGLRQEARSPVTLGVREDGRGIASLAGNNLGQLAAVFEAVARVEGGGDLPRMSDEIVTERQSLRESLQRRKSVEHKTKETRDGQLRLAEELRKVQVASCACRRQMKYLQDELKEVEEDVRAAEAELATLKEASSVVTAAAAQGSGAFVYPPQDEYRDVLARVRAERDIIQKEHKGIKELQLRLDSLYAEKNELQELAGAMLQKQQMIEKDRGLMLTSIEGELKKLNDLREARVTLLEEREQLEREITDIVQQTILEDKVLPGPGALLPGSRPVSGNRMKGVPYDAVAVLEDLPYEPAINRQRGLVDSEVGMLTSTSGTPPTTATQSKPTGLRSILRHRPVEKEATNSLEHTFGSDGRLGF